MRETMRAFCVILLATIVAAQVMDTIQIKGLNERLKGEDFSDTLSSTVEISSANVSSRAAVFRAPCISGGQKYWPHPTSCNKNVVCTATGKAIVQHCKKDTFYWQSQAPHGLCIKYNGYPIMGQSPIKKGESCQCGLVNVKPSKDKGRHENPNNRIVGGKEVAPLMKYPWHVGLKFPWSGSFTCGGSIVRDQWVITAAHCVVQTLKNMLGKIFHCHPYQPDYDGEVWVGDHDQFTTCDDSPETLKYRITEYIPHEKFDCKSLDSTNINTYMKYDIALLKLGTSIPFNNRIRPICLPTSLHSYHVGDIATVTGWGSTFGKHPLSSYLKEVQMTIGSNFKCGKYQIHLSKLCLLSDSLKGQCNGDSGGPVTVIENNKHVLVGIVSFTTGKGCEYRQFPGISTRVAHREILPWIHKTLKNDPMNSCQ